MTNEEQLEQLVSRLRAGVPIDVACVSVGVDRETFDELTRDDDELRARVERALAESEVANVVLISQAARGGNWLAASWLLERLHPQRYARPSQRENEKPQTLALSSDLDDLAERRSARRAGGAT